MSQKKSSGLGRTRNYATTVYLDSAPENWKDILASHLIPCFISPIHNKDINPTGEPKKAHYHVIIMFEGVKTREQAKEVFDTFNGVGVEVIQSLRGYTRYLCHLDNPEKAQYSQDDVISFCGADYSSIIGLASDKYKALTEMEEFCEHYNIISYYALSRYASLHRTDWSRVLKDNGTIYMKEYLQSRKWSIDNNCTEIIDPNTGEKLL